MKLTNTLSRSTLGLFSARKNKSAAAFFCLGRRISISGTLLLPMLLLSVHARAGNLMTAYHDALLHDPRYAQARAEYKAAEEKRPEAWAALLPHLSAQGGAQWDHASGNSAQVLSAVNGALYSYNLSTLNHSSTKTWSISLTDTLFSFKKWMALKATDKEVARAAIAYEAAKENLIARTATAYFSVLSALDHLTVDESSAKQLAYSLKKAQAAFSVGLEPVVGVAQAKAARDEAFARLIQDKERLSDAEDALATITGRRYHSYLAPGRALPLSAPQPARESAWEQVARTNNLTVLSRELALEASDDEVEAARGSFLPSLKLAAIHAYNHSTSNQVIFNQDFNGLNSNETDNEIALEISVPLFEGGAHIARLREREFDRSAAEDALRYAVLSVHEQVRHAFLGVASGVANIKALETSVQSHELSFHATEEGYAAGSESETALLRALDSLRVSRMRYERARYRYILSVLALYSATGHLDSKTIYKVNQWFTRPLIPIDTASAIKYTVSTSP